MCVCVRVTLLCKSTAVRTDIKQFLEKHVSIVNLHVRTYKPGSQ